MDSQYAGRPLGWQEQSKCAEPNYVKYRDLFFSEDPEDILDAKSICETCPVRRQCLSWALDNKEIWGVWGGRDENEIRTTLSLSDEGQEIRRTREGEVPICLHCGADTKNLITGEIDIPGGGRWTTRKTVTCSICEFMWISRTSANAVESHNALQAKKL